MHHASQMGHSACDGITLKSSARMDVSAREMHRSVSSSLVFETLWDLRLLVSYQGPADPTDAEWSNWIVAADALWKKAPEFRLLVVTEGGHPTRQQLDRLRSAKRSEPLTVIISSSTLLYFVASIVALFNPHVDCFSPAHRDRAYSRIGLAPEERPAVDATISRLRQKLEEPAVTMGKGDRAS